jgi:cysteine-S-conjugate beta-lyase
VSAREYACSMNRNQFDDISLGELRRRRSYKWRAFPSDVLPSFVAEMDFMPAPVVAEALVQAVELGDCGYAWPDADLAESVSGFFGTRFGWQIDPAEVTLIPDVMTGVAEILRRALAPGEGVVINTPVYPPFFHHIGEVGCRVVEAPLRSGAGGYELDLAVLEAAFASGARAYLLCSPHNPTGRVFSRAELEAIVELAERYDVLVLADEIHAPLVLPGAHHTPFLSLGEAAAARGIALVSASKGWNIPGLKCAQIVTASEQMRALIGKLPHELSFRAGNLGIIASTAAYRDGGDWLDELLAVLDRNRRLLAEILCEQLPQVRYVPPQATYLAWLDCRALGVEGPLAEHLVARAGVALVDGNECGPPGAGHVRLNLATPRPLLRTIVEKMAAALR